MLKSPNEVSSKRTTFFSDRNLSQSIIKLKASNKSSKEFIDKCMKGIKNSLSTIDEKPCDVTTLNRSQITKEISPLKEYNKIFNKKLRSIFQLKDRNSKNVISDVQMVKELNEFGMKNPVNRKIIEMKNKVYFMRGIVDFSFPKILAIKNRELNKKMNKKIKEFEERQLSAIKRIDKLERKEVNIKWRNRSVDF